MTRSARATLLCVSLVASSDGFLVSPLRFAGSVPVRAQRVSPCLMESSSRRAARRAKRQEKLARNGGADAGSQAAAPSQPVLAAVAPIRPAPSAPASVPAPSAPAPAAMAAVPSPMAPLQADGPFSAEEDLTSSFVQDKQGVALPSIDDFRRREGADDASPSTRRSRRRNRGQANPPQPVPVELAAPMEPVQPVAQTAQEKLFELLTFDKIDDRVERSADAPYDATARLIGRGVASKGGAYLLPYLQTGHVLLLLVLLLSSTVSYPGFPLTEVPDEYRDLLKEGIIINYAVNAACAVYSRGIATRKEEPVTFWFVKVLLLGGLALGELTQAVPDPPARKSRR